MMMPEKNGMLMLMNLKNWINMKRVRKVTTPEVLSNEMIERKKWWKELSEIVGFTVPLDGLISAATGKVSIDILKFDTLIANRIPEYNYEDCLYKGKESSMRDVMLSEYGERAVELTEKLI